MKRRWVRIAKIVALVLVALELLWLLAANALIASGLIQKLASEDPSEVKLEWGRAYSPWPGRAYVRDFTLRLQDPTVQFRLTVAHAHVDVKLLDLLHREFHGTHVVADGVTYRLLVRADSVTEQNRARVNAYPPIEGFARPPLAPHPPPPPSTAEEIAKLWSVELDDCDASIDELWFLEYRYLGHGHARGSFELKPLRWLWVDAQLALDGGTLSLGNKKVNRQFAMRLETNIHPIDLQKNKQEHVLRTLDAHVTFDTPLQDLSVVDLYLPGLGAHGTGRVIADVRSMQGRLMPGSTLEVKVGDGSVSYQHWHFIGSGEAKLSVTDRTFTPQIRSTLTGQLGVPVLKGQPPIEARLESVEGRLTLTDNRFSEGLHLGALHAEADARVDDASRLAQAFGVKVPVVGRAVLGQGPLIAIATAHVTPQYKLVRVRKLSLGHSEVEGALRSGPHGWNGAASGRFSALPFGFKLRDNKLSPVPFVSQKWLATELEDAGIQPQ